MFAVEAQAAQVKYSLPESPQKCGKEQVNRITLHINDRREVVFFEHGILAGWYFYDVEERCVAHVTALKPLPKELNDIDKDQPGTLFEAKVRNDGKGKIYFTTFKPVLSDESSYEKYKEVKIELDKKNEEEKRFKLEKRQKEIQENSIITVPYPKYMKEDHFIKVEFDGNRLKLGNKTSEFVTVQSISTYYNGKINTISDVNRELPPESEDTTGISNSRLFSDNMRRTVKRKDLEMAQGEPVRMGFAIKYTINGAEKKFYSVLNFKNGVAAP